MKISERTRRQLDKLPPEKRAKALEVIARTQTTEYKADEAAAREALDREYRETGRIAASAQRGSVEEMRPVQEFLASLRKTRESLGLSLNDIAVRTGIDKAAISRLETGRHPNPTVGTLLRYATSLGKRMCLTLEEPAAGRGE